ncbi:MAG: flagellar motor protein MotB [bacterium]|jgi:chemotaxis protein MotB|nr:flagellar motor protein MotB [bacterium]
MADQKQAEQPIIIKRIVAGHGHHGGSWKVAFADFATAMMAFFLLLWILNQATDQEKAAISGYFNNPYAVDLGGSQGVTGTEPGIGEGGTDEEGLGGMRDQQRLEQLEAQIKDAINTSEAMKQFRDRIDVAMTPEGVRIQVMDKEARFMFALGSSTLEPGAQELLRELATVISTVPNRISISGHTDALPYGSPTYTNWELSTDRANTARREMLRGGLDPRKIGRVVGLASTALLLPDRPEDPMNRRITILVMNRRTEESIRKEGGQLMAVDE